ncbi:MAG: TRAP transporter TatT component family protein [Desulfosarcinaceae bacterium]|nr:TRAP transporter TatT component family protein [Desulfosarcinaceae bacterium]
MIIATFFRHAEWATGVKAIPRALLIAALSVGLLTGCTPRQAMVEQFGSVVETGLDRLEESGDIDLVAAGLPGQITLLETLLANDPQNERLRLLLARLYAAQGLLFLEPLVEAAAWQVAVPWEDVEKPPPSETLKSQMARVSQRGARHAMAVLEARNPGSAAKLANVRQIGPYLQAAGPDDVPALFWYAFNLGAWIHHHPHDLGAVVQAHVAERIMNRVVALQPGYYYGFAHLFLIAYYGSRPPMLGGDPATARRHYAEYLKWPEGSLSLAEVFYSRYVLTAEQAREDYLRRLKPIAAMAIGPDTRLFEAMAIRRAQLYLAAVDRLFEPDE